MIRFVIAAALALAATLPAVQAQAQAIRTFVSAAGSDSNPCSITQPCRHFSAAVAATSAGGEVDALDPGAYGSFTISHAITIEGQGWSYVAPPSNGNAITITANAGDNVKIHGVSLNGVGATSTNGILFTAGGSLTVDDCVVQNFSGAGSYIGNGILMQPAAGPISFAITNTTFSNNGYGAIFYVPVSGSATATGVIDHVVATNNVYGVAISTFDGGGSTTVAISNSITNNNTDGIFLTNGPAALAVSIDNTSSNSNAYGIYVGGTPKVTLGRSVITANTADGISNGTGGTFYSYQDNRINENVADINGPLSSLALH